MRQIFMVMMMVLLLAGCTNDLISSKEIYATTFRLAESHPIDHPTTRADHEFARLVAEKSDNRIEILVYENKLLGEEKNVIHQLQFGAIDFARVSSGPMTELVPELNVIQLPFLYKDGDHMWRVLQSDIGDSFLEQVGDAGLIGFGWMDAGARNFYNRLRPIETLDDLKGLRLRTMESDMMTDMVETLGATAKAMPYGEVYGGILTGVIDGAENNWPSYDTSSHYQVAGYYSVDEHVRVPEILLGSKKALEALSEEDMAILYEAARETEIYQRKLWKENEKASEERLIDAGVVVNVIEDRSAFREAMIPLYHVYAEEYMDVIRKIQSID